MTTPLETLKRLEYLKDLHAKYGRYVKSYFGFSYKDIADFMGIKQDFLGKIIMGKCPLPEDRAEAFDKAFEHFGVMNKSKDFKESESQKQMRELYQRIKKSS